MKVIAYGPPTPMPAVPEVLILELGGYVASIRITGETSSICPSDVESRVSLGSLTTLDPPEPYVDGSWMVLDVSGPKWLLKSEVEAWKLKASEDRVREGALDPNERLSELGAAAALRSIDLSSLVKGIQARALPGETLADAFLRLRGKRT